MKNIWEMIQDLWWLVLLFLILLFLVFHYFLGWNDGIWLNIATEVMGILVTVMFVERVLRQQDRRQWKKVEKQVNERVEYLIRNVKSLIFNPFFISPEDYQRFFSSDEFKPHKNKIFSLTVFLLEIENLILPSIETRIVSLSSTDWQRIGEIIQAIRDETEKIIDIYDSKLSPDIYHKLNEFHKISRDILVSANIFVNSFTPMDRSFNKKMENRITSFFELVVELGKLISEE